MDIRRYFDRFIDTNRFTDGQLMQLLLEEKRRSIKQETKVSYKTGGK